ncbi:Shedu anti-phage system protein SduA domain-containing protein [Streptomyces sp. NPDC001941]|uniref:Shedu anti-phage system protein SduA domain-containing protein n=1 Tax=Streptomyces sp. NPDC001941 TaxID=3154659 RepID=UPI003330DCC0
MTVRVDATLEWQLDEVAAHTEGARTKAAIAAVFAHMRSGSARSRKRRGGRELIRLLEEARSTAAASGEWQVVRLLQDSLDYAEHRILRYDFEERYRLFQAGKVRSDRNRDFIGRQLSMSLLFAAEDLEELLGREPEATAAEAVAHLRRRSQDANYAEAPEDRPGWYRITPGMAEMGEWVERILRERRVEVGDPAAAARRIVMSPESLSVLAADAEGQLVVRAVELQRRAAGLRALRTVTLDPYATEHDVQKALEGQYWIFGGAYVGEAAHRRLVPGDEVDIPLVRGDGALHVVELKRAMSLRDPLVKRHRGGWVATAPVHDAVGQAINYLVGLDEHRERIRTEFGLDTRRAGAMVLIGHPAAHPEVPEEAVNEALRTLNAQLVRVEVLTYKELVDNAERALGRG